MGKWWALAALLASVVWIVLDFGAESITAAIASLGTFVYLEIGDERRLHVSKERLTHNRELFRRYEGFLSERQLIDELNMPLYNRRTDSGFTKRLDNVLSLAELTEGRFLDRDLQSVFAEFSGELLRLRGFIVQHFFRDRNAIHVPGDDFSLYLYPDLKYEDEDRWDKHSADLLRMLDDVETAYGRFRSSVKETLSI